MLDTKLVVKVEWENGEITYEPLNMIAKNNPVSYAIYARKNGLLETPGWKRFKGIARREKKLLRMANQVKVRSYCITPKYKFGFVVPRDCERGMQLDKENRITKFKDCTILELNQIDEYKTFIDLGKDAKPPEGPKKIGLHLVYDIKYDGRHLCTVKITRRSNLHNLHISTTIYIRQHHQTAATTPIRISFRLQYLYIILHNNSKLYIILKQIKFSFYIIHYLLRRSTTVATIAPIFQSSPSISTSRHSSLLPRPTYGTI